MIAPDGKTTASQSIKKTVLLVQFGTCRSELVIVDDIDASNAEIAAMFDFSLPITAKAR